MKKEAHNFLAIGEWAIKDNNYLEAAFCEDGDPLSLTPLFFSQPFKGLGTYSIAGSTG